MGVGTRTRNTVNIRPSSEVTVSAYKLPYISACRPGNCYEPVVSRCSNLTC